MSGPMLSDLAIATDWFELACLAQSRPLLRHSEIQRLVALADPDMDLDQVETAVSDILAEVQRRSVRAGALYPFTTGLRGLHRRAVEPGVELLYKFLALCSVAPSFRSNQVGFQPGRAFERIAAPAMGAFVAGEPVVFADIDEPGVRARIRSLGRMMYRYARDERTAESQRSWARRGVLATLRRPPGGSPRGAVPMHAQAHAYRPDPQGA